MLGGLEAYMTRYRLKAVHMLGETITEWAGCVDTAITQLRNERVVQSPEQMIAWKSCQGQVCLQLLGA